MNAVVAIVSREGLASATVRRIAQELDCSPGQIHHHFASAEALRAEAVREVWRRIAPDVEAALRRMPPHERLFALLSGCSDSPLADQLGPSLQVAERLWKEALDIRREAAVREAIAEGIGDLVAEIQATLADGARLGIFPRDLDVQRVALRLLAASQGYEMLHEIGAKGDLLPDKRTFIADVLRSEDLIAPHPATAMS